MMDLEVRLEPFREPRGFIKLLQWFFALCAFCTTLQFSTDFGFQITCKSNNMTYDVKKRIEYPFDIDQSPSFKVPDNCIKTAGDPTVPTDISFLGNAEQDAEYFVTTGILSFLYCMIAAAFYLLAEKIYQSNNKLPVIDFIITLILAIFWLSASAAWAKGLSTISGASDIQEWIVSQKTCSTSNTAFKCHDFYTGSFSKLVVSILFGFINFVLWGGNLWFLYKETTWFESIMKNTATSNVQDGTP